MAEVSDAYIRTLAEAEKTFAEAVGPRWATLPEATQRQLFGDAWRIWGQGPGEAAGLVRRSLRRVRGRRGEPARQELVFDLLVAKPDVVAASFEPTARDMARRIDWGAIEDALEGDEPAPAAVTGTDVLTRAMIGGARAGGMRDVVDQGPLPDERLTDDSLDYDALGAQLSRLRAAKAASTDPRDRALGLLIDLHLGERVILGAPKQLYPPTRYSTRTKQFYTPKDRATGRPREDAYSDFLRYHTQGRAKQSAESSTCPTCRLLARFLRAPGLTPGEVTRLVNNFILTALS